MINRLSRNIVLALATGTIAATVAMPVRAETTTAPITTAKPGATEALPDLVQRLAPAVVSIATTTRVGGPEQPQGRPGTPPDGTPFDDYFRDYFNRRNPNLRRANAVGSGFIIDPKGLVVTNNHVVKRATDVKVILNDGTRLDAKILGTDPRADLALLQVKTDKPLPFVPWGKSSVVRVGESVVAIGNPFGLGGTVTTGIISARHRHLRNFGGIPGSSFVDFLQTDAAINKGNSGGPLFNMKGEVIGINTAIYSRQGTNLGIAFAVPSDLAKPIVAQLQKFGRTRRGWLGVQIQNVDGDLAKRLGIKENLGALVANVVADGPAAKGGIMAGDVIVEFDGKTVPNAQRLPQIVAGTEVGKAVSVIVIRKRTKVTVKVTLGELEKAMPASTTQPDNSQPGKPAPDAPVLGMRLSPLTDALKQQYKITAEAGVVVTDVDPRSNSASKGIRPGDMIVEIDLVKVATPAEVRTQVEKARAQRKPSILMLVQRGSSRRFIAVRF